MIFTLISSLFGEWGIVALLLWLAILLGASYLARWLIVAALNMLPALAAAALWTVVLNLEPGDNGFGAALVTGLAMYVFFIGLVASALGAVVGIFERGRRSASLPEEN